MWSGLCGLNFCGLGKFQRRAAVDMDTAVTVHSIKPGEFHNRSERLFQGQVFLVQLVQRLSQF